MKSIAKGKFWEGEGVARKFFVIFLLIFGWATSGGNAAESLAVQPPAVRSTDWMRNGGIGLSSHYFAYTPDQLPALVNGFQVQTVASQVADTGAKWLLFSLFHRPWVMNAPNRTFEKLIGSKEYTSERDLPLELYKELSKREVRLMLYLNLRLGPERRTTSHIVRQLGGWPPNDMLVKNISAVLREFSLRYGSKVAGWWVDGVQVTSDWGTSASRERWFSQIADALRAGNQNALVAFNPGHRMIRYSAQNDFVAGESRELAVPPRERFIDGAQWHSWTYLGNAWGSGGTRFDAHELFDYSKKVFSAGGALTFEVGMTGITRSGFDDEGVLNPNDIGRIDPVQVDQIRILVESLRKAGP